MKILQYTLFLVLTLSLFLSCKDDDEDTPSKKPTLSIVKGKTHISMIKEISKLEYTF